MRARRWLLIQSRRGERDRGSWPGWASRDKAALAAADHVDADRLAWVLAEAPKKKNPAGFARAAIVKGWEPPEGWTAERADERKRELRKRERAEKWEEFRAMGQAQRLAVADHYRQGHFIGPSLAESPPERPTEPNDRGIARDG